MSLTVFPSLQPTAPSSRQSAMMRERVARARASASFKATRELDEGFATGGSIMAEDAIGLRITPIYRAQKGNREALPGLSFSAQLLELSLKHNVEGLIKKAQEQLSYQGALPISAQSVAAHNYERAQDNFAHDHPMVERNY